MSVRNVGSGTEIQVLCKNRTLLSAEPCLQPISFSYVSLSPSPIMEGNRSIPDSPYHRYYISTNDGRNCVFTTFYSLGIQTNTIGCLFFLHPVGSLLVNTADCVYMIFPPPNTISINSTADLLGSQSKDI